MNWDDSFGYQFLQTGGRFPDVHLVKSHFQIGWFASETERLIYMNTQDRLTYTEHRDHLSKLDAVYSIRPPDNLKYHYIGSSSDVGIKIDFQVATFVNPVFEPQRVPININFSSVK